MSLARNLLVSYFILPFFYYANSQTEVQGGIFENTIWTIDQSPYLVVGDVIVFEGFNLTIEPGVEVLVNPGVQIEIRNSSLIARGTINDTIKIRSVLKDSNKSHWKGFVVKGLPNGSPELQLDFAFCYIANAHIAFDLDDAHKVYQFQNNHFQYNTFIRFGTRSGESHFNECLFSDNYLGFEESYDENDYIDNCLFIRNSIGARGGFITNTTFRENSEYGVYAYNTLINCEIYNNYIGVISHNHADTKVISNYIHDNQIGVQIDFFWNSESIQFEGNTICNNETWNIDYKYENAADLTKNCWCLETEEQIKALIKDAEEDLSLGLISVDPTYQDCASMPTSLSTPLETNFAFNVFPNPTQKEIFIDFEDNGNDWHYIIFNAKYEKVEQGASVKWIDVSHLLPGIYTVSIINNTGQYLTSARFVKQ